MPASDSTLVSQWSAEERGPARDAPRVAPPEDGAEISPRRAGAGDWNEPPPFGPLTVAVAYFAASALGLLLPFPGTEISIYWLPNAILLAALLNAPRRRWMHYLLAIVPAHVLSQGLIGLPADGMSEFV